jgi:hypothetical protein
MMLISNVRLLMSALALVLSLNIAVQAHTIPIVAAPSVTYQQAFLKTELFFGMDKGDGTVVTDEEWNEFLKDTVTPRFPEGLTVLEGYGQYKNDSGKIVRERSKVIIFLYPLNKRRSGGRKLEQIRNEYKKRFKQESVMRIDYGRVSKVSF